MLRCQGLALNPVSLGTPCHHAQWPWDGGTAHKAAAHRKEHCKGRKAATAQRPGPERAQHCFHHQPGHIPGRQTSHGQGRGKGRAPISNLHHLLLQGRHWRYKYQKVSTTDSEDSQCLVKWMLSSPLCPATSI